METTTTSPSDVKVQPTQGQDVKSSVLAEEEVNTYFGKPVLIGNRIVIIKQVKKFSMLPTDPGAKFLRDEVQKKIGSQWKAGTKDINRGLSPDEEKLYLPDILGISSQSNDWNTMTKQYWANFTIEIPVENGLTLEVGFKKEGSKVSPINLQDYITYQYAKCNSKVTTDPEQFDNPLYDFFILDKGKEKLAQMELHRLGKVVNVEYYKLIAAAASGNSEAISKIDSIIELKGGERNNGANADSFVTKEDKELELERIKDADMEGFSKLLKDSHLGIKGIIKKAVNRGLIEVQGETYFYMDKSLGNTLMDVVGYFENQSNATQKIKLMEAIKTVTV